MSDNYDTWLILEPYVQVSVHGEIALFYNTLSGKVLEFDMDLPAKLLVSQLLQDKNGYVAGLSEKIQKQPSVTKLIKTLKRYFMIDTRPAVGSMVKPVNLLPFPVLRFGMENSSPGLQEYLYEITLHLNDFPEVHSSPLTESGFRQFLYPVQGSSQMKNLDINLISSLLEQVASLHHLKINLLGSDITKYPEWETLFKMLKKTPFSKSYYILSQAYEPGFTLQTDKKSLMVIMISPPFGEGITTMLKSLMKNSHKRAHEYNFIVACNEDVEIAAQIIQESHIDNAYFKPFFNGSNHDFFSENVYLSDKEIIDSKPNQNQVFSRKLWNENDFGKLTVLPDGSIFANVNDDPLGNLEQHQLKDLVSKELKQGKSWKRTRLNEEPCKKCIYQWLCPPISNYEIFMKKFNFCHLYQ